MKTGYEGLVLEHYRKQAEKHGDSADSTMEDNVVRAKEVELILAFLDLLTSGSPANRLRVLDLGCGNGYALSELSESHPALQCWGLDYSDDLLQVAEARNLARCEFLQGDARRLPFDADFFDAVYTERCLINLLDWEDQQRSLREIHRVLKPGCHYLMIECFSDGLANNNRARTECGLSEIAPAYHNKYFEKDVLFPAIERLFTVVPPADLGGHENRHGIQANFLSSHYFVARVLHPLVTKGEWVRNTEFVKFFSFLPPVGNYSPIQAHVLKKKRDQ